MKYLDPIDEHLNQMLPVTSQLFSVVSQTVTYVRVHVCVCVSMFMFVLCMCEIIFAHIAN